MATLSIRSVGLGILPIGSVGIVIGAGVAILPASLESIIDLTFFRIQKDFGVFIVTRRTRTTMRILLLGSLALVYGKLCAAVGPIGTDKSA